MLVIPVAGWWFQICLYIFDFHPYLGKIPLLNKYVSKGLKPPAGKTIEHCCFQATSETFMSFADLFSFGRRTWTDDSRVVCVAKKTTPRKINMEPEITPLEKESHLPNHHFQVQAVNLQGCRGKYGEEFIYPSLLWDLKMYLKFKVLDYQVNEIQWKYMP